MHDTSSKQIGQGEPLLPTLIAQFPFRSIIARPSASPADLPPIVASLILRPGCAFTSADLAAALVVAEQAIRDGGAVLILAMNGQQRHDAKRRLIAAIEAADAARRGQEGQA